MATSDAAAAATAAPHTALLICGILKRSEPSL
jgi:hypothetical protein